MALLRKEQTAEGCDATAAACFAIAGNIKKPLPWQRFYNLKD
jgi:hypothetical protein